MQSKCEYLPSSSPKMSSIKRGPYILTVSVLNRHDCTCMQRNGPRKCLLRPRSTQGSLTLGFLPPRHHGPRRSTPKVARQVKPSQNLEPGCPFPRPNRPPPLPSWRGRGRRGTHSARGRHQPVTSWYCLCSTPYSSDVDRVKLKTMRSPSIASLHSPNLHEPPESFAGSH